MTGSPQIYIFRDKKELGRDRHTLKPSPLHSQNAKLNYPSTGTNCYFRTKLAEFIFLSVLPRRYLAKRRLCKGPLEIPRVQSFFNRLLKRVEEILNSSEGIIFYGTGFVRYQCRRFFFFCGKGEPQQLSLLNLMKIQNQSLLSIEAKFQYFKFLFI